MDGQSVWWGSFPLMDLSYDMGHVIWRLKDHQAGR